MKYIKILIFTFFPLCSISQIKDSISDLSGNYFQRKRGVGESSIANWKDKLFITENGDTLILQQAISMGVGEILYETSIIHNKRNGLEISYYPNGKIKEINYFLNDKIWEVIYRADSTGKSLNPGNVTNGNGIKYFFDIYFQNQKFYETFKNGLPEGMYYGPEGIGRGVKGRLTYNKSVVNYFPAKKVIYISPNGEKATEIFNLNQYKSIFEDTSNSKMYRIISVQDDSVMQEPESFSPLEISFDDPAIIPVGEWVYFDLKSRVKIESFEFDNSGNVIKEIIYSEGGKVFSEKNYAPCNKRKIIKRNSDGSFLGRFCNDNKAK